MDRSLDRTGNSSITDIFRPTSEVDCGGISPRDEGHQLRRRAVTGFSVFFHLLVFSWPVFLSPIRGSRSRALFLGGTDHSNGNRTWSDSSGSARLCWKLRILYSPRPRTVRYHPRSSLRLRTTCAYLSIYSRDCGGTFLCA